MTEPDSSNVATLEEVYSHRFPAADAQRKSDIWRAIVRYLSRFVPSDGVVLDLACDRGDFIRHVSAREKWASDLRDMSMALPKDVRFVRANGLELSNHLPRSYFDLVFMSNYLEHLESGGAVVEQFRTVSELLKLGGRVMVLQPNIRLTGQAYWDFIDHKVALTDRSLVEAAELGGLVTERVIKRFLPYTTKGRLPQSPFLTRAYLAVRPAWLLLGKQTLYVGRRM